MKRAFILVLALLILAGCSSGGAESKEQEKELTGNFFLDADVDMQMGKDASGNVYTYRRILVDKDEAISAGMEQFVEFAFEKVSLNRWYTVCFTDGTGVCFLDGSPYNVAYGTYANSDWTLVEQYGYLTYDEAAEAYEYFPFEDVAE